LWQVSLYKVVKLFSNLVNYKVVNYCPLLLVDLGDKVRETYYYCNAMLLKQFLVSIVRSGTSLQTDVLQDNARAHK